MTEYVALLRGVNVGGVTVRSADLRALFAESGFADARTYLASGNVRFSADGEGRALKTDLERALAERFGYDAWIVLVTLAEMRAALDAFPFDASDEARQPYVVFCADPVVREELLASAEPSDEDPIAPGPGVVYWTPPKGSSVDTAFAKQLAKPRWKAVTTTRNLRTVARICV